MDKRVIFAVAGSGKSTYIIDSLNLEKRVLIVTYTVNNYENLKSRILRKFNDVWPENVTLMSYFQFLYSFCYKPFLSDKIKAKGVTFEENQDRFAKSDTLKYFMTKGKYLFSNRLAFLVEKCGIYDEIKSRIEKYFDAFVVDEVQDIAGRDFNFLKALMDTNSDILLVGDFYQHTYDTSRDGKCNATLFDDRSKYEQHFLKNGLYIDSSTLNHSWRCGVAVCRYVCDNLGITIQSNRTDDDSTVEFTDNEDEIRDLIHNHDIIKLHYQKSSLYGTDHKNWGETKGIDSFDDVCVLLNKSTYDKFKKGKLKELPASTRNKLYVAITRAHGNVYLVEEARAAKYMILRQ